MDKITVLFLQSLLVIWLGLDYHLVNAQSISCPLITIDDLGNTTEFSDQGLVAQAVIPPGEAGASVPVRIRNFTRVCDAAGDQINTSSFVSMVVEFQCNSQSAISSLTVCSDPNNIVTRQYQFQCTEQNGQLVWGTIVSGSNLFVETLNPTANLSTPLADQCRRCIDDQQSSRADPITHCDPCPSQCDQGQGRCYLGLDGDMCCSFYLQNICTNECPSALVNDSNFICVCPSLSLANGDVSYSPANRDIGSVATYTCNSGYQLSSQQAGMTRICSVNGWSDQNFTCVIQCPDLSDSIENGKVVVTPPARTVNSTAEYSCDDGYKLDKGDVKRTCQDEGTWSGQAPQCIVQCPDLGIENGEVIIAPTARTVNSTAEYSCNDGYKLDKGDAKRTCQAEGTWSGQAPQCFIQCPDLGDSIENGEVVITPTARTVNSIAEYSCDDGYKLDKGDGKRICQAEGTWTGEAPQCNKQSNIAAIVGGVVGGLVVLGIIVLVGLVFGITVAVKLRKRGELDALKHYEELAIDDVEQYKSKEDKDVHLEESPSNAEKDDH